MTCIVDSVGCSVRDGDTAWPFVIDYANGGAHIHVADRDYTLRPLGWRQKRNLARYSHLGEQFLQTQFLRASLDSPHTELPKSASECDALSALARWLNAPDGNFGLPLDTQLLASVTLEICRDMNLPPAAFDTLDAAEVELLWKSARDAKPQQPEKPQIAQFAHAQTLTARAQPGMQRIVVIPDAAPAEVAQKSNRDLSAEDEAAAAQLIANGMQQSVAESEPNWNARALAENRSARAPLKPISATATALRKDFSVLQKASAPGNRFRVELSKIDTLQTNKTPAASLFAGIDERAEARGSDSDPVAALRISRADDVDTSALSQHSIVTTSVTPSAPRARWLQNVAPIAEPAKLPPHQLASNLPTGEQLFAEFADVLEEAARAAGIDLEN